MKIRRITDTNVSLYVDYAGRHGRSHDESFIPDGEFKPDDEHPAFMLGGDAGDGPAGAAGLLLTPSYREAGRGRVTILHANDGDAAAYRDLTEALRSEAAGRLGPGAVLYGYIPESLHKTRGFLEKAGWREVRRNYLMVNDNPSTPDDHPPDAYSWSAVKDHDKVGLDIWRGLINRNFSGIAGHVETTLEAAEESAGSPDVLGGGLQILERQDAGPIGAMLTERDDDDPRGSFLAYIAVEPAYRGKGLGRLLLRRGLALSRRAGLNPTWLSVNAENETAFGLYRSEGFKIEKVMVNYEIPVHP